MVIFNEAKIKYERLDSILEDHILNVLYSKNINIIIDLKEIYKKFFRPDVDVYDEISLIEEISSDVINTLAHYRNYFYKKDKYTTFFVVFSNSKCENIISENSNYKKDYYEKYLDEKNQKTKIILKVNDIVQTVVNMTPNSYFINSSEFDEFVCIKYILDIIKSNELTFILSNDLIFSQLLNSHIFQLTVKGIKSELISNENFLKFLLNEKEDTNEKLSGNLISIFFAIAGYKKYSIPNIPNIGNKKALMIIKYLLEKDILSDINSIDVPINFSKLNKENKLERLILENKEKIENNYKLIKMDTFYSRNYTKIKLLMNNSESNKPEIINSQLFLNLNSKPFTNYPINIEMLLKGEKLK